MSRPEILFDGTQRTFARWRKVGQNDFALEDGAIVTVGSGDFAVLYYAPSTFDDFVLRLEFRLSDSLKDNSGVFVRFRNPELPPTPETLAHDELRNISRNPAWIAVCSGFEIQIDEQARGSKQHNERDGLNKNRTGAVYKIPTGDNGEPRLQEYHPGPALYPGEWNEYAITVTGDTYVVELNGRKTTTFVNTDPARGLSPTRDPDSGYIGLQSYRNSRVGFRNIRVWRM